MADTTPAQRIVPGAPPPPPLSKSQKKKRKSVIKPKVADAPSAESILAISDSPMASSVEKAHEEPSIQKDVAGETSVAPPLDPIPEVVLDKSKKASPAVELLNKRIKVQTKKLSISASNHAVSDLPVTRKGEREMGIASTPRRKMWQISRIAVYSSKLPSELNEDQRKSVASLPFIQGAVKELEETKKAVEVLETEEAKEREKQHAEEEKAMSDRIAQAVSDTTVSHEQRISEILSLLRLSSLLAASDPTTFTLTIDEKERHALYITAETLLGFECPKKAEVVSGLLHGHGDIDGVAYERLWEVVEAHRNPPVEREPTPIPEEPVQPEAEIHQPVAVEAVSVLVTATEPVSGASEAVVAAASSGSFHFMQESELEASSFEHGAEWVEKPEESEVVETPAPVLAGDALESLAAIDTGIPLGINGVTHLEEPPLSAVSVALDWAADDGDGLPSINSLHAKFGTSGEATPEASPHDAVPVAEASAPEANWDVQVVSWGNEVTPTPNGTAAIDAAGTWDGAATSGPQVDEEGFVKARGSRGRQSDSRPDFRGRGRGGFRGDRGGEYRGGMLRVVLSGEIQLTCEEGYRGRGGGDSFGTSWRGGDGEFRGRGGYRGDRGRGGDFRGDFRGRGGRGGDFRGRGRGHRGGRGGLEGGGDQGDRQPPP
ncbi:hypothetical protein K439DRAFT_1664273 [Ramaria rubella]|nr:hypothetical protein K439DRAFT_1664273 [Ramaria rubella]